MGLFKEVKKPVIRHTATAAEGMGPRRPAYAAKTAPCIHSCPCGTDVRGWLVAVAQHKEYQVTAAQAFENAWRTILEHNPFPAICGRVCQHPCELNCNRKGKDGAVAVNRLEQFIGDFAIEHGFRAAATVPRTKDAPRVAIVGAGPAGLSCAYHLARIGCTVTMFDAEPQAGGMMRYRIPRTVIPANVLDAEIGNILGLGIGFRAGCEVGRDVSLVDLRRGHDAIFFAMGLQKVAQLKLRAGVEGAAAIVGEIPATPLEAPASETTETIPRILNTVSVAIAQGQAVSHAIADFLQGRASAEHGSAPVIRADYLKFDWYPASPRFEVTQPIGENDVLAEAARCMSCGMCMDCETCWMYCSKNCFVKLPKGEHYKIKTDLCNGCGKCAESCPCGYIEMN